MRGSVCWLGASVLSLIDRYSVPFLLVVEFGGSVAVGDRGPVSGRRYRSKVLNSRPQSWRSSARHPLSGHRLSHSRPTDDVVRDPAPQAGGVYRVERLHNSLHNDHDCHTDDDRALGETRGAPSPWNSGMLAPRLTTGVVACSKGLSARRQFAGKRIRRAIHDLLLTVTRQSECAFKKASRTLTDDGSE